MAETNKPAVKVLESLQEHIKELSCLFEIEEFLSDPEDSLENIFKGIVLTLPSGMQYVDYCFARIIYENVIYDVDNKMPTNWLFTSPIKVRENTVGTLEVYYTKQMPSENQGPFLENEVKLIQTVAERIGHFILHQHLKTLIQDWHSAKKELRRKGEWRILIEMLRKTDRDLFLRIARKMMNHLCWRGVVEADKILGDVADTDTVHLDADGHNQPTLRNSIDIETLSAEIFKVASSHIPEKEIFESVQKWMQEDKASFLVRTLINLESSLGDVSDAVRRFHHLQLDTIELPDATRKGLKVSLVRRFLSDQLEFIKIAKDFVEIKDFIELIPRLIHPERSHGKLGGKSAGLFLAARVLRNESVRYPELNDIKIPRTFHITSDGLHSFMHHNNLEDVTEQKYKDIEQARLEYPHILHLFKSSHFPPDIVQGVSMALDEFGEVPLIVRSSSLLEDRLGSAFSGKYSSLFLANRGPKSARLEAILDAIAEVYASTFGSDPIEYRAERGLLDFHEEMGILIQEVVGTKVGKYFMPTFAGVAFNNNEFRWSPRIKREDGLVRIVPGLGTRAVDRLSDDFSMLVAPGQPNLRVNVSVDEVIRYSCKMMDVINLENGKFETINAGEFLKKHGAELPGVEKVVSVIKDDHVKSTSLFNLDFEEDDMVVNFEGLIHKGKFIPRMKRIMEVLQENIESPVDIEFASDGHNFFLLQCRPQSYTQGGTPTPIPKDIPENAILFSASKYISNGQVPDITHIVYVDPDKYNAIEDLKNMKEIGRVVGHLNKLLPKRKFILMGPGRWGSRGDIKLGVNVTYSDINNTAMLIEIARKKGNYVPDLSFGTHFFQDLVEASIRYLPLYPDETDNHFNEHFLLHSKNILSEVLPEYAHLEDTIRVIDVNESTNGKILRVYMNADIDSAVSVLSLPSGEKVSEAPKLNVLRDDSSNEDHWRWRYRIAERIAAEIDADRFGVKNFYLFGSSKNATATAVSDIDIMLHVDSTPEQCRDMQTWLDGWSTALDEMNFLRTGFKSEGLLDIHIITDADIARQHSYAKRIDAVTDAAKKMPLPRKTRKDL
jgi:pyruvate, water dikinase